MLSDGVLDAALPPASAERNETTDVVLLHGAWHAPEHWAAVADLLGDHGRTVLAPDVNGLSLEEGAARVQPIIDASTAPPVVVAHSYGGVLAGSLRGASSTIYLAAWLLAAGESPRSVLDATERAFDRPTLAFPAIPAGNGLLDLDRKKARHTLYGDVDDQQAAWALDLLRPEPADIFSTTPQDASWSSGRAVYVACRDDHANDPGLTLLFAERAGEVRVWPSSHSAFLSHPERVAALIEEELARRDGAAAP